MSQKANYFKLGIFIIAAAAILVAIILALGAGNIFKQTVTIETYFDESVQGLDVGSPVMVRGVQIGRVKEIGLVSRYYDLGAVESSFDAQQKVLVLMELRDQLDETVDLQHLR